MRLDEYLKLASSSQSEFGASLVPPASQGLVSQWIRGVTRVTLEYAIQIENRTGGQVTPKDCAEMFADSIPHAAQPVIDRRRDRTGKLAVRETEAEGMRGTPKVPA
jgi:DNA-binding transcriptional regulator YdaS (Cro superfamily)